MDNFVTKIPKKDKYVYRCVYCQRIYDSPDFAYACVKNHDLILVPIAKNDLNKLVQFLFVKDDGLLTKELHSILTRSNRRRTYETQE